MESVEQTGNVVAEAAMVVDACDVLFRQLRQLKAAQADEAEIARAPGNLFRGSLYIHKSVPGADLKSKCIIQGLATAEKSKISTRCLHVEECPPVALNSAARPSLVI